jgi:hypothetical protein
MLGEDMWVSWNNSGVQHGPNEEIRLRRQNNPTIITDFFYATPGGGGTVRFPGALYQTYIDTWYLEYLTQGGQFIGKSKFNATSYGFATLTTAATFQVGETRRVTFTTSPWHSANDWIAEYDRGQCGVWPCICTRTCQGSHYGQWAYVPAGGTGYVDLPGLSQNQTSSSQFFVYYLASQPMPTLLGYSADSSFPRPSSSSSSSSSSTGLNSSSKSAQISAAILAVLFVSVSLMA